MHSNNHVQRLTSSGSPTLRGTSPRQSSLNRLLYPRRYDDNAHDLWTTFNVAQENVIRGGLSGIARDAQNRRRRTTTRQVNGIDQDVRLNKALWVLAIGEERAIGPAWPLYRGTGLVWFGSMRGRSLR